ncbi:hypothetical protein F9Y90_01075 [Borrelia miyamotoi]|uniref:Uncharacterized protein n=1 Tax=Borrelia miyamotoi TaxID=47466 RepID=A0AAX3JLE4_9SPIR|nr:hypothetical protein [Borrelia miyamotoi]QFP41733.1 hypothetical protein F9Y90_01075 [Borrelia miyamotoi]QFP47853.1 hypothetical protein F9Y91_01070 [Borrelia miyamotoi]QGT55613.1 hypothetical protein GNY89_01080 [Borrelia miyamotoi]QGT56397.1 hypothetical protein GNY88_01080 [Borrelia miyamotoi]WAZ71642.1 hypothetical protein O5404_01080 [Borrelia miyamotoi]
MKSVDVNTVSNFGGECFVFIWIVAVIFLISFDIEIKSGVNLIILIILIAAAVINDAIFCDNLSLISDIAIVSNRIQKSNIVCILSLILFMPFYQLYLLFLVFIFFHMNIVNVISFLIYRLFLLFFIILFIVGFGTDRLTGTFAKS